VGTSGDSIKGSHKYPAECPGKLTLGAFFTSRATSSVLAGGAATTADMVFAKDCDAIRQKWKRILNRDRRQSEMEIE